MKTPRLDGFPWEPVTFGACVGIICLLVLSFSLIQCGGDAPPIGDGSGNTETRFATVIVDETAPDAMMIDLDYLRTESTFTTVIDVHPIYIEPSETTFTTTSPMIGGGFELLPIEPAEGRLIPEPPPE